MGKKIDPKTKDAEATFVKAMNERAKKLGCTGTVFENPHGLDFDEWAGDMHSTAHDVALMMQEAMKNDTIREVVASEDSWIEVTGADGSEQRATVFDFEGAGVLQGQYNKDDSIRSFARSCFNYALDVKQDLWFGAKDTISKKYDHTFKDIFQEVYDAEYKEKFEAAGITYFYSLIDDIVARVIRSEGGFVWACKNYDGDVMSDMVSTAFGSLAMMTSVLVSPDGKYEYEAAHGTVTRHYYKYLKGEKTSTNPMATIFAWSGALKKRGELDDLPELVKFGEALEAASLQTLNDGIMTKDLCGLAEGITPTPVDSEGFIKAIRTRLEAKLA